MLTADKHVFFVYSESKPQLQMNVTANGIIDGETVSISCSLKYATARNMNLSISVIQHPGSDAIDTDTQLKKDSNDIHSVKSVTTVKANSQKNREGATAFGPVKCTVELTVTTSAAVLASNRVQFTSDEIPEFFIPCKCDNKFCLQFHALHWHSEYCKNIDSLCQLLCLLVCKIMLCN